jgi:hypothetical protein
MRHLGSICELSVKRLGWVWESFGNHLGIFWSHLGFTRNPFGILGSVWDAFGGSEAEEASGMHLEHLGIIWESFGSHLGAIWDPFGSHLGAIRESFGGLGAEEASGRHLEVSCQKLQYLSAKMQKFL